MITLSTYYLCRYTIFVYPLGKIQARERESDARAYLAGEGKVVAEPLEMYTQRVR